MQARDPTSKGEPILLQDTAEVPMSDPELDVHEIKVQHEILFETLHAIEAVLPDTGQGRDRPRVLRAARALLQQLADQLQVHFATEERNEYFGRSAACDPRLAPRIEQLLRDHRELLELARCLAREARQSDGGVVWVRLSRTFWLLRERLAWHEREENELSFQLHHVDVGESAGG